VRVLYFDCFSGASGDMVLGALIDAGVALEDVRGALGSLAISPDSVWTEPVVRAGIRATKFCVTGEEAAHAHEPMHVHAHEHSHGHAAHGHRHGHHENHAHTHSHAAVDHHDHRSLTEINQLIDRSALSAGGKTRAKELFQRLGEAEAAVHGTTLEKVHLHEVGALDSIIDIVGAVHALETLGIDRVVASPLNVGSGSVRSAHGLYPVPAPATLRLLKGAPIYSGPQQAEMVTPTGALLVSAYASEFGAIPPMKVRPAGTRARPLGVSILLSILIGASSAHPRSVQ